EPQLELPTSLTDAVQALQLAVASNDEHLEPYLSTLYKLCDDVKQSENSVYSIVNDAQSNMAKENSFEHVVQVEAIRQNASMRLQARLRQFVECLHVLNQDHQVANSPSFPFKYDVTPLREQVRAEIVKLLPQTTYA